MKKILIIMDSSLANLDLAFTNLVFIMDFIGSKDHTKMQLFI